MSSRLPGMPATSPSVCANTFKPACAAARPCTGSAPTPRGSFAILAGGLAPDRIVAGFGAGGSRVLTPMGLAPRRPFAALAECVEVVDGLLRGEAVDHQGEFAVRGGALPWSPGTLPLAIAGRGPRVEHFAARRADWILLAGRAIQKVPALV